MSRRQVNHPIVRPERDQAFIDTRDGEAVVVRRAAAVIGWHAAPEVEQLQRRPQLDAGAATVLVKSIERDCLTWYDILRRMPYPVEYLRFKRAGQGARWFEMLGDKVTDWAPFEMVRGPDGVLRQQHAKVKAKRPPPTSAEISWMDRMDDVLFTLGPTTLAYMLVTGRAQRASWADLGAYDPERRKVRQLQNLYRAALHNLMGPWLHTFHKI